MKWSKIVSIFVMFFCLAPMAFTRGHKVIVQVVNGTNYRTVIVAHHIGDYDPVRDNLPPASVEFEAYLQDGSSWNLATNRGTGKFTVQIAPLNTIRIETTGTGTLATGYVVLRDKTPVNSSYSIDFNISYSVFYEIISGGQVTGGVSVNPSRPTMAFALPLENDVTRGVFTGFAVVNL